MALLQSASVEQLRRLLEFFPAPLLKAEWPGTKGQKKADVPPSISHWLSLRTDRMRSASGRNPGQYEQVFRGVDCDAARFV